MKVFLKKSAILAFVVLLFCVGLELLLLTKPNVYSYKRKYIENHLNDIAVLFMGNSHIEEALIPEMMCDSGFNFAISAKPFDIDAELADRYIPHMENLKVVVMPLSYNYFEFNRLEKKDVMTPKERRWAEKTYKCMQRKYLGIRRHGIWYCSELLNSNENYMNRLKEGKDSREFCDSLGYVRLDVEGRPKDWRERRVPGKLDPTKEKDIEEYEKLFNAHESVARLCQEKGARLVLVSAPVYKTYQDAINDVILNDIYDTADSLKSMYPNVEYYNFFFAEGFEDEDFRDAGHLTYTGAIKFSKMFADSLFSK